ncbi:Polyadenylate-binding protein 2 [Fukomys damarensis]|uniref:Polyadenylate-binding protein 2 n=1 Tax=Fukomys damarensis TaxID=885580 RepID=A0A091DFV1_FUKDA|nr:Polyadenylate-binding protein 2 [Fukomys damarensis]
MFSKALEEASSSAVERAQRRCGESSANAPGSGPGSGSASSQEEEESRLLESDPGSSAVEDLELGAIKAPVREKEEEAKKLKEMQNKVEKQTNMSLPTGSAGQAIMSVEERTEADAHSISVGSVNHGAPRES